MKLEFGPIQALVDLITINQEKNMVVAEVGTWQGETTVGYAKIISENEGKLILVDWFNGNKTVTEGKHAYNPPAADDIHNNLKNNLEEIGCSDIATILKGDSVEMSEQIPDESLDICFIDAAHMYDGVMRDIKAYLPKVKKGGILCGHDCLDMNLANTFTKEQLEVEYIVLEGGRFGCHPGVIQAVYDNFGNDVTIMQDSGCHGIPIWIRKITK
jgi:hypothetical protein